MQWNPAEHKLNWYLSQLINCLEDLIFRIDTQESSNSLVVVHMWLETVGGLTPSFNWSNFIFLVVIKSVNGNLAPALRNQLNNIL